MGSTSPDRLEAVDAQRERRTTSSQTTPESSRTERLLSEIATYLRISAAAQARAKAKSLIDSFEKATVYSKLDGVTAQAQIEADTKVPNQTISDWLRQFVRAGLVSPPGEFHKRPKALFTLDELDISLEALGGRVKRKRKAALDRGISLTQGTIGPEQ